MSAAPVCHFCHNPMQIIVVPTDDGPSLFVAKCIECDNIVPFEHEGDPGLAEAIRACGSRPALARKIGLSPRTVEQWHRVPQPWLHAVSMATGIRMRVLRPDLFTPSIKPIPPRLDVLTPMLPAAHVGEHRRLFLPTHHSAEETLSL